MKRFLVKLSLKAVPRVVWVLGIATFLIETASQTVQSLLAVFLVTVFETDMKTVGALDGIAKALAALGRAVFGRLSDKWGRKPVLILGYGLMMLGRPLFPLAQGVGMVAGARFCDTISRGIAFVSRDALTGDSARPKRLGKNFGLLRAMTELGAFLGPLTASGLMIVFLNDFRLVFWAATVPSIAAFLLIVFGLKSGDAQKSIQKSEKFVSKGLFSKKFWILMGIVVLVIQARLSNSLLSVYADQLGLELHYVPLITLVLSVSGILFSYPLGSYADSMGLMRFLSISLAIIAVGHGVLAVFQNMSAILFAAVMWGVHSAIVWSVLPALVVDHVGTKSKGEALGVYGIVVGMGVFIANVGSGWLWDAFGAQAVFEVGAWYSLLLCFLTMKAGVFFENKA